MRRWRRQHAELANENGQIRMKLVPRIHHVQDSLRAMGLTVPEREIYTFQQVDAALDVGGNSIGHAGTRGNGAWKAKGLLSGGT